MARRSRFSPALLALATLSVAATAHAQAEGPERISEVRRDARGHIGPLYFTPAVQLKEFGVDSNVFNAAGEQQSDFTFTVGPKMDVWVPVARRALLKGTATSDLVWYSQYDSERSIDPGFSGRGELYLRRVTLFADAAYLNTRQRLNYEVDLRARHVRSAGTVGADVRLTPKLSVEIAGGTDETRFDADTEFDGISLQRTLNQQTTTLAVAGKHQFTPLTTFVVRYEQLRDEFEFSPVRDSESYRVMPGVEFKPRALISGKAYVGYRRFTPAEREVLPEFSGLVAQLGLSYTLLGSTTFGVSYARDLTYSYTELQPFFVNQSVGVSVRRAVGRRFDVLLSGDRHAYDYENLLLTPVLISVDAAGNFLSATFVEVPQRRDITWNYSASLGYRIGDGRVGFGVAYWQRESPTNAFRDYDNLRFGTTVTYGF